MAPNCGSCGNLVFAGSEPTYLAYAGLAICRGRRTGPPELVAVGLLDRTPVCAKAPSFVGSDSMQAWNPDSGRLLGARPVVPIFGLADIGVYSVSTASLLGSVAVHFNVQIGKIGDDRQQFTSWRNL